MPVRQDSTEAQRRTPWAARVDDGWTEDILPRLPVDLDAQARALGAFRRVRGLATSADLLRALLVFALEGLSTRGLGAWAVLAGVADLSEAAWRKRLVRSSAWLGWLLGALLSAGVTAAPGLVGRGRRIRLVDATRVAQVGGTGDDWRVHLAYDLLAGRMDEVVVSDRHTAEGLDHFRLRPGDVLVADRGYGYRRQVATARASQADVVLRIDPRLCPLEDDAGQPCDVETWLRAQTDPLATWTGWCRWKQQRHAVRVIASALPPDQRQRARLRKERQAKKKGRTVSLRTLLLAGWWLLVTTLDATTWPACDIVALYRARWQVELLFKRLKQLLCGIAIRARSRAAAEATVRAILVAWALQERLAAALRTALPVDPARPLSLWRLAHLSLTTLAQAVRGHWTLAHLRACLPRLTRFLQDTPRRRAQQAATVSAWLLLHPGRADVTTEIAA